MATYTTHKDSHLVLFFNLLKKFVKREFGKNYAAMIYGIINITGNNNKTQIKLTLGRDTAANEHRLLRRVIDAIGFQIRFENVRVFSGCH